jgi:hypothetical protein
LFRQFSQEYSFLQEIKLQTHISRKRNPVNSFCFITMVFIAGRSLQGRRKRLLI